MILNDNRIKLLLKAVFLFWGTAFFLSFPFLSNNILVDIDRWSNKKGATYDNRETERAGNGDNS